MTPTPPQMSGLARAVPNRRATDPITKVAVPSDRARTSSGVRPKAVGVPLLFAQRPDGTPQLPGSFARIVAELSEPPGYFDTDNLVSNVRSYLHVVPELRALADHKGRGCLSGRGTRPELLVHRSPAAVARDHHRHRRENMLLHLLFKALFAEARTRVEYLALLTGRPPPPAGTDWRSRSVDEIIEYVDRAQPLREADLRATRARLTRVIDSFGVPLSESDRATIDRFHRRFIAQGLSLRFNSFGRPPQYIRGEKRAELAAMV